MNRQAALEAQHHPTTSSAPDPPVNLTFENNQAHQHHHHQQQHQQLQRLQIFPHDNTNAYQNLHAQQQDFQQQQASPQRQLQASNLNSISAADKRSGKSNVPDNASQAEFFTDLTARAATEGPLGDERDAIQMTRAPSYSANPPMASNPNPYGQTSSSSKLDYSSYTLTPTRKNNNQRMSKTHAHSTSLLANDSYMACMSSDSEISGASRHHHRPYSSQSRVYHAHLAPKPSAASSRMSHYSEPTTTYVSNDQTSQQQKQQPQRYTTSVARQGSVSSSGSGGSASSAAYLALTDPPISSLLQQQQGSSMTTRSSSGRQLPHHRQPFKQSMSIDHHSAGQYHHNQPVGHHQIGHLSSPAHTMSPHYELSEYHSQPPQHFPSATVMGLGPRSQSQASQHYPIGDQRYGQRNFRLDMDLLDKQTAAMNIYDNESASVQSSVALPPTASRQSSSRQLPPITLTSNVGSSSLEHLQHQIDPYHPSQVEFKQQQQQKQKHQDMYTAHQVMSTPAEWLPPIPSTSQHLNRTSGAPFNQTMSIDHYPPNPNPQRLQQYSQARGHLSEHFRGSLNYVPSASSDAFDAPPYQSANSEAHGDIMYQQYVQEQQHHQQQLSYQSNLTQQQPEVQAQQYDTSLHSSVPQSNLSQSQPRGPANSSKRSNLQHQVSSSSSNSGQSGSLRSSNIEINKSLSEHHKTSALSQLQHQQSPQHKSKYNEQYKQGALRKGYTSVAPSLSGSGPGFNEPVELSTSPSTTAGQSSSGHVSSHLNKRSALRAASPSVLPEATTSLVAQQHHHSGSSKEGAGSCGTRSESSTGLLNGAGNSSSLTKKSNSATQLSMTGTKKRLGFRKKQVTSFSVHRSEEVAPLEARHLVKQGSSVSEGDSSMSGDSSSRSWSNSNFKPQTSEELASMSFIDGLGRGQMISRQGLASPYLGDLQLSLCDRRGNLEIEVIRARNLQAKTNKILPLTYVKLYLVKNRKCLAKAKTTLSSKRTLDPLFQQQLTFHEDYHGCILQSIIWGNFGKMDKKNFMGIAQISIDDLELSDTVISWYKLFLPSSLQTLPSKSLRHTLLSNSTESFTNANS